MRHQDTLREIVRQAQEPTCASTSSQGSKRAKGSGARYARRKGAKKGGRDGTQNGLPDPKVAELSLCCEPQATDTCQACFVRTPGVFADFCACMLVLESTEAFVQETFGKSEGRTDEDAQQWYCHGCWIVFDWERTGWREDELRQQHEALSQLVESKHHQDAQAILRRRQRQVQRKLETIAPPAQADGAGASDPGHSSDDPAEWQTRIAAMEKSLVTSLAWRPCCSCALKTGL